MIPWVLLGTAHVPGGDEEMRLYQRGSEYSIRVGSYELMNSRVHASEDALATVVCDRLIDRSPVRILIGGLGMGFTLASMLQLTSDDSEIVVAELVKEVIDWNRGVLGEVSGRPLDDARVNVVKKDVGKVIRAEENAYDAILLDVDNGPSALTSKRNDWLYSHAGLRGARAALKKGGILAIWSGGADPAFTKRLEQCGFRVEELRVRGTKRGGPRYLIWVAVPR